MPFLAVATNLLLLVLTGMPVAAFDLTVVSYNVESDADTDPAKVVDDLRRIPASHVWGLSEVNGQDFDTYRRAIGEDYGLIAEKTGGEDRLAIVFDSNVLEKKGVEELSRVGATFAPCGEKGSP